MNSASAEIQADLRSHDQARVERALNLLVERMKRGPETTVVPFGTEIFDGFGPGVPEVAQLNFVRLMADYEWFEPALSPDERASAIVAVLSYGVSYVAFDAALKLKISDDPVRSVSVAMDAIAASGLPSPRGVAAVSHFVSCLLDGKPAVRRTTIDKLRSWPSDPAYLAVIEHVKPELEDDELEILGR